MESYQFILGWINDHDPRDCELIQIESLSQFTYGLRFKIAAPTNSEVLC
jgi:hypothetical protein